MTKKIRLEPIDVAFKGVWHSLGPDPLDAFVFRFPSDGTKYTVWLHRMKHHWIGNWRQDKDPDNHGAIQATVQVAPGFVLVTMQWIQGSRGDAPKGLHLGLFRIPVDDTSDGVSDPIPFVQAAEAFK
jgi:hypothetical protein